MTKMKLQLCSIKLSKLAKQNGFDWPTLHGTDELNNDLHLCYDLTGENCFTIEDSRTATENSEVEHYLVPTLALLQKWFRDIHNIAIEVGKEDMIHYVSTVAFLHGTGGLNWEYPKGTYSTYEKGLEAALIKAFDLI